MGLTLKKKRVRHKKLQAYIKRTTTMAEAKALAKEDGVAAPSAAWIMAWAKLLDKGELP